MDHLSDGDLNRELARRRALRAAKVLAEHSSFEADVLSGRKGYVASAYRESVEFLNEPTNGLPDVEDRLDDIEEARLGLYYWHAWY